MVYYVSYSLFRSTEYVSFFEIDTQFSERKDFCARCTDVTETYRYC